MPEPGTAPSRALSVGYAVQPDADAPPGMKNEEIRIRHDNKNVQYDIMFKNGKAISRAPICSGIRKLPKVPVSEAVRKKKTIMVPCMVTSDM